MRTGFCFNDLATVFGNFLRLSLFSVGFFTFALLFHALLFFLLLLRFQFGKFFLGISNIDLTYIVKINVNLLCAGVACTLGFINNDLIDKFVKH